MGFGKRIAVGDIQHNDTLTRGADDAHPVAAITGLPIALENLGARIDQTIGNLYIDGGDYGDPVEATYDGGDY